jgi:hypothetical protein
MIYWKVFSIGSKSPKIKLEDGTKLKIPSEIKPFFGQNMYAFNLFSPGFWVKKG